MNIYFQTEAFSLSWLQLGCVKCKKRQFIFFGLKDELLPIFMEIIYILSSNNEYFLVMKKWITIGFNEHINAYNIMLNEKWY